MDTTFNTITNAKKVVDNIRKEIEAARGTRIWDDYVNALRLISQVVFTRSSGFILELIQNAEDSGLDMTESGTFEIRMNQQRVKISHNGRPFNENDVKAISGIRSSKNQNVVFSDTSASVSNRFSKSLTDPKSTLMAFNSNSTELIGPTQAPLLGTSSQSGLMSLLNPLTLQEQLLSSHLENQLMLHASLTKSRKSVLNSTYSSVG